MSNVESRIAALQSGHAGYNPLTQIAQMRQSTGDASAQPLQRDVDPSEFESFMAANEAAKGGFEVLAQHQQHRPQLSMSDSTVTPISDAGLARKYRDLKVSE
jgi:hypothetical protein